MQYFNRKHFSHKIQFHREKVWFIWKKFEKMKFFWFFFQNRCWPLVSFANFSKLCQKISKLSLSVLWRGFEIKSQQRRTHYLKWPKNGGQSPVWGGGSNPPLPLLGLSNESSCYVHSQRNDDVFLSRCLSGNFIWILARCLFISFRPKLCQIYILAMLCIDFFSYFHFFHNSKSLLFFGISCFSSLHFPV